MNRTLLVVVALACWAPCALAELLPFGSGSLQELEREHAGAAFAVVIWSTDCVPCRNELALVRRFAEAHPNVRIVLIAADDISNADAVLAVLSASGLEQAENWVFADRNRERLQYSIDPKWFGEIPRAYLYSATLARTPISGALSATRLEAWLAGE